jgi:hypothetical protein
MHQRIVTTVRQLRQNLVPDTHIEGLWLGRHRTFLVDGSSFSMPGRPELQAHCSTLSFTRPRPSQNSAVFVGGWSKI